MQLVVTVPQQDFDYVRSVYQSCSNAVYPAVRYEHQFLHMTVLMIWLDILILQQLQQQNLGLPQFVLVQPGHPIATPLQSAQFIISQPPQPQGEQNTCSAWFWCRIKESDIFSVSDCRLRFLFISAALSAFHSAGILQTQSLLTQLPQSQANLLPTQPSIALATQVGNDASTSFNLWKIILAALTPPHL